MVIVRIGSDGAILEMSPGAEMVVTQLYDVRAPALNFRFDRAPCRLLEVANRLRNAGETSSNKPPSEDVQTLWGRFRLRAHVVQTDGSIVTTIRRFEPDALRRWKMLADVDLAPAERRIALEMCGPSTSDAVAAQCGLTVASYRQYARRIYGGLDVDGRDGLRQRLDG